MQVIKIKGWYRLAPILKQFIKTKMSQEWFFLHILEALEALTTSLEIYPTVHNQ